MLCYAMCFRVCLVLCTTLHFHVVGLCEGSCVGVSFTSDPSFCVVVKCVLAPDWNPTKLTDEITSIISADFQVTSIIVKTFFVYDNNYFLTFFFTIFLFFFSKNGF